MKQKKSKNTKEKTFHRFDRLAVIEDYESILQRIREEQPSMDFQGHSLPLTGLRLKTFATSEPCCSNPDCGLTPAYFAVERQAHSKNPESEYAKYHLNLYGIDSKGREILFTHDHTLARGMGGADSRENTTLMCHPCNFRKAMVEGKLINTMRDEEEQRTNPEGYALKKRLQAQRALKADLKKLNNMIGAATHFLKGSREEIIAQANAEGGDSFHNNNTAYASVGLTPKGYKWLNKTISDIFKKQNDAKRKQALQ